MNEVFYSKRFEIRWRLTMSKQNSKTMLKTCYKKLNLCQVFPKFCSLNDHLILLFNPENYFVFK